MASELAVEQTSDDGGRCLQLPQSVDRVIISDSPSGFVVLSNWVRSLGAAKVEQKGYSYYQAYVHGGKLLLLPESLDSLAVNNRSNKKSVQLYHILKNCHKAEIVVVGARINVANEYCTVLGLRHTEFLVDELPFEVLRENCLKIYRYLECKGFKKRLVQGGNRVADVAQFYL